MSCHVRSGNSQSWIYIYMDIWCWMFEVGLHLMICYIKHPIWIHMIWGLPSIYDAILISEKHQLSADHFRSPSGKMCCYCLCARRAERMLRAAAMDGVFFVNGWWGLCCWSRVAEILSPRWALYLGRLKTEMARVAEMFGLCGFLRSHVSPYDHLYCELS